MLYVESVGLFGGEGVGIGGPQGYEIGVAPLISISQRNEVLFF